MHEYIQKRYVVFLLVVTLGKIEATVENGGYSVLVSFSQNVPSKDGEVLLNNMKESLKHASEILHNAIGMQFSKVTFKIPTMWDTSEWNLTVEPSPNLDNSRADFLIDNANDSVFGKLPFAQQYGSCGIPGRQIRVPSAFFDEANGFPKGVALTREWLKYRYGVFDENGYLNDSLYPSFYTTPGSDQSEIKITDCTNAEVKYNFVNEEGNDCSTINKTLTDSLNSGECWIKPDENLDNITSSMMYFQQNIHTLEHICEKDSHNSRSPNKQNVLCQGRSIWDVVKNSKDIKEGSAAEEHKEIEYVYVQDTKPRVVVAWESTANLKDKGAVILNAIKKFMIDLPDGSKFSGFPFKASIQSKDFSLRTLDGLSDKTLILDTIFSEFIKAENGNISLALSTAMDILSSDTEEKGTIIIVTSSNEAVNDTLLKRLTDSKACVMFIFFSDSGIPDEIINYTSVSKCSSGITVELPMANKDEETFEKLLTAMESILPSIVDNKATETVKTEYLNKDSSIIVPVDDFVEKVTFWIFNRKDGENFKLKSNDKDEDTFEEKHIGSILTLLYSPVQSGNIELTYLYNTAQMLTHVTKTSKTGEYFTGDVFIRDTSEEELPHQMPVIIYAFIRFGAYPVQNAKISANVTGPSGTNISVELHDNGRGDPDITKNDGIYSRYFIDFSGVGEYTVTITVQNGDDTTYGTADNTDYHTCCGSYVNGGTPKLPEFSKEFSATFSVKKDLPESGYKPSRITDLRILNVMDDKITLKWTAPGGQADYGTASSYEIKLFCGEENVTACEIHNRVNVLKRPQLQNYGTEQEMTIQILTHTQILSLGIVAVNKNSKFSDMSNIIEIFRPSDKLPEIITKEPDTTISQATSSGTIIGTAIVGILIITCVAIAIVHFYKRKPATKRPEAYEIEENMNNDNPDMKSSYKATDHSVKSAPVKKIQSFPVLLYTHNEIKDFKDKGNDPPLYKSNIPPKLWASLDVISNIRNGEGDRDATSLGSSSGIQNTIDGTEKNVFNDTESQTE